MTVAYNVDCMEAMAKMDDNAFDLAIVDPPYGIERFKKSVQSKAMPNFKDKLCEWDKKPSKEYFTELFRISANQIIWGANNFNLPTTEYFCIWDKKQPCDNFARCEYAWVSVGLKKPAKIFEFAYWGGMKKSIEINQHPTQKPVALYKWLLKNYAKEGDRILDTHLGSGSSRIAAYDMGFEFVGYEIDKDYFDAQEKRFTNHIQQGSLFEAKEMY